MNDEMDVYLSRCLKNWAARQPIPENREDLLEKAAAPPQPHSSSFFPARTRSRVNHYHPTMYRPLSGWLVGPFTATQTWSLHLATTLRTVA